MQQCHHSPDVCVTKGAGDRQGLALCLHADIMGDITPGSLNGPGYMLAPRTAMAHMPASPREQAPLVQQLDEAVRQGGGKVAWEQLLGQQVEGLGVPGEEVDAEDGLWCGQVVPLQLRVQACTWSPHW